ncbi:hypothetical protein BVX98_05475 [bacterium F11]|nr:hypothetical protein BVX98_05475 [bacterium F11]
MDTYEIVVIGAGRIGRKIARELSEKGKKVAIVTLNDDAASIFERTIDALHHERPLVEPDPHGPPNVNTYRGFPRFESKEKILSVGDSHLQADRFVIATGAIPAIPPVQGLDEVSYETPLSLFSQEQLPSSLVIIGGGPVAVSLACVLAKRQSSISLICANDRLLIKEEPELSKLISSYLEKQGVTMTLKAQPIQVRSNGESKVVVYEKEGTRAEVEAKSLVVATGFVGHSREFGFENQGVYINGDNRVVVNEQMETAAPHIWAAGSVTGPPFHLALSQHQADLLIHNLTSPFFFQQRMESEPFPSVISTQPPIATVGLKEEEARKKYKDTACLTTPYSDEKGLIKLVGRKRSGEILGAHIIGPHSTEMILFLNLAKRADVPFPDLLDRQHYPSPTFGEALYHAIKGWVERGR